MNTANQALLDQALRLPEPDRTELVERLLESLSVEVDETADDAWLAELERRSAEFRRSREGSLSWEELMRLE